MSCVEKGNPLRDLAAFWKNIRYVVRRTFFRWEFDSKYKLHMSPLDMASDRGGVLYVLEGGGNDILDSTEPSPDVLGYQIALGLAESEFLLREAGARHFVVPNLFNVGLLPAAAGRVSFATKASEATNRHLDEALEIDGYIEDLHILRMDVFDLLSAVKTDPTHFGFVNITNPCLTTAICPDPDHTFFWDTHHPTVFGHAFFAVTLENVFSAQHHPRD